MLPIVQNIPLPPGNLFGAAINYTSENINARNLPITIVPKTADVIRGENDLRGTSQISGKETKKKSGNITEDSTQTYSQNSQIDKISLSNSSDYPERMKVSKDEAFRQDIDVDVEQNYKMPPILFEQASKIFESIILLSSQQPTSDVNGIKEIAVENKQNEVIISEKNITEGQFNIEQPISIIV